MLTASTQVDMDAADTAELRLFVTGEGADNVDIRTTSIYGKTLLA